MPLRPPPTVSFLFAFLGTAIYGSYAWTTLDNTSRPLHLASDEDRHCPAAAIGVEHGSTRTLSM